MKKSAHQSRQPQTLESWISRGLDVSEELDAYEALHDAFIEDCNPRDIIQRTYVTDVANLTWEIRRARRLRAHVLSRAYMKELISVLMEPVLDADEKRSDDEKWSIEEMQQSINESIRRFSTSEEGRREVAELLQKAGRYESDIEITAFTNARSFIDAIDHSLATMEIRRLNAVRFLMEYSKAPFARRVEKISKRLIESEAPPLQPVARYRR